MINLNFSRDAGAAFCFPSSGKIDRQTILESVARLDFKNALILQRLRGASRFCVLCVVTHMHSVENLLLA